MDIEAWLKKPAERLSTFWYSNRITLLATVAVNLLIVALLLLIKVSATPRFADQTVLIGIEPEPIENESAPLEAERQSNWGEHLAPTGVRNITVDATQRDPLNAALSDEKHIDAQALYEEAARVREEMQANRAYQEEVNALKELEIPNTPEKKPPVATQAYSGPSVASYYLQDRKAYDLPIPAYKCKEGGTIVVDIVVSPSGHVLKASIDRSNSQADACLWEAALIAARRSLFSASASAPQQQAGSITYTFIPQ